MTTTNGGHAEGLIEVKSYVPTTFDEAVEGPKLVEINVTETFTGQIRGEGRVRFVQAARSDGSASYVGIERVVGTLAGRKGSFLLQDSGTVVGEDVAGEWWFVIPGSGTGELKGLCGDGGFKAKLGQCASIWLDYRFE